MVERKVVDPPSSASMEERFAKEGFVSSDSDHPRSDSEYSTRDDGRTGKIDFDDIELSGNEARSLQRRLPELATLAGGSTYRVVFRSGMVLGTAMHFLRIAMLSLNFLRIA